MLSERNIVNQVYRILNKDEKTVARLVNLKVVSEPDLASPVLCSYLSVVPVRGYPRYTRMLHESLKKYGEPIAIFNDIYTSSVKSSRLIPAGYTSKTDLILEPDQPAELALKSIFKKLLASMLMNEAGIKRDIDTEFLHDYRIAVRKSRSALSQVKNVFSPETARKFRQELKKEVGE